MNGKIDNLILVDTRESAFVHAITAAGAVFTVGKACAEKRLKCGCKPNEYHRDSKKGISWSGCQDGVDFGYKKSKRFMDGEDTGDLTSKIRLHNNEAGRRAVTKYMQFRCKCHGWATACGIKSCWKVMPSFRDVGTRLLEKFQKAERVRMSNDGRLVSRWNKKPPLKETLVYEKRSPSFCEPKKKLGSFGTHGRQCYLTDLGIAGCDLMCCGRGYSIVEETKSEICNCDDKCDTCTHVQNVTRCL